MNTNVDVKKISTESRNQNTLDIDVVSTEEMLRKINNEDKTVPYAVEKAIPQITKVVDATYNTILNGGRLIYMGAGTSGRLGVLDAVECPPTYGVSHDLVIGLMAGGVEATSFAKEGAEDRKDFAVEDLKSINLTNKDIVIGIAASGRTPYVLGGIEYAKSVGALTSCITTSSGSVLAQMVDLPIEAVTGAEVINGSTRMKSGTAQKLICNMISTGVFIKMGKVYENMMIDLQATNEKLVARALNIIMELTGYTKEEANEKLSEYKTVKKVLINHFTGCTSNQQIDEALEKVQGNIRKAINLLGEHHE
ncbi:MAG: N-acetylmuramic acid 6-phosphate etherase [Bacilli bacterium]|nr:N-acetylmuramic acid 6-phosphate etherase [Bacilli bacterium]